MSFSDFEYAGKRKQTRRERFLAEIDQVVPLGLIEPFYPMAGGGRKPYPLETMLRIRLLQSARSSTAKRSHAPRLSLHFGSSSASLVT
ncbi:hypothetical protein EC849_102569 [Pseudomonas putida]|nr:hypothetical protein EC849_102569 [Pseudomonas putida]